jgi:hypothetical protein
MNETDILQVVMHYRLEPDPLVVPPILSFTAKERLMFRRETAIPWSGVIDGFCTRYPEHYTMWKGMHYDTLMQSIKVTNHIASKLSPLWADHLLYRWLIIGRDQDAWALLLRAHDTNKDNASAAQRCIEKVCMGIELADNRGLAKTDSSGTTQGILGFPDLRQQMLELNEEFRVMTVAQRGLPFSLLPFSREFQQKRHEARMAAGLQLPAGFLQ